MIPLSVFLSFFMTSPPICDVDQHDEIFEKIYNRKKWGVNEENEGASGSSSTVENTFIYRVFLQDFLHKKNIRSVVDLGCGDWEFSRLMDWDGIEYLGYDVVPQVIENNLKKFSRENIFFICENFLKAEIPKADLMICKNVLQHFSNETIMKFLKLTSKFKYCLISNRVNKNLNSKNFKTSSHWHGIDLSLPPFNVKGKKVLSYLIGEDTQEVFLIENSKY